MTQPLPLPGPLRRLRERLRDTPEIASAWVGDGRMVDRHGGLWIALDYPPARGDGPRWGHGRPGHPGLEGILKRGTHRYRSVLQAIASRHEQLAAIPLELTGEATGACWRNPFLLGFDCAALYALLSERRPARYVEVGSGHSTRWADRARRDAGAQTRMTSIDPEPRVAVAGLADEVVVEALEDTDLAVFADLCAGDVVFFDGSHRAFMGSDATVFFCEVLPALAPGVLVGVHDVFLPADYPPDWAPRFYSEQYLLAAWLLAGGGRLTPVLPCHWVGAQSSLAAVLDPLWSDPRLAGVDRRGFTFWLETAPA